MLLTQRQNRRVALAKGIIDDGRAHGEVAKAAGLTPTTFSGLVSGRIRTPKPETRAAVAAALGRPETELFPELTEPPS